MRRIRRLAALAMAGALAGAPGVVAAQEIHPGEQGWLGLTGADIPPILKAVADDPYKAPAAPACETIPAEILALDKVLGAEADKDKPKPSYVASYAAREAKGAIRGLVPYRGVVRFLTGADRKDRALMAAAQAGWARRGFLRGLEANLHCAPQTQVASAPAAAPADAVRRVETAFAPGPIVEPGDGRAQPDGARADLADVMLIEPRVGSLDQPGR